MTAWAHEHDAADLAALGWDTGWAGAYARHAAGTVPGRIARVDRAGAVVLTPAGATRATLGCGALEAAADDETGAPCTGDWAAVRRWPDGRATIETVLPRRTALRRASVSRTGHGAARGQVLAVNADVVFVMVPLTGEVKMASVERLLAVAHGSGARPVVVLTKADLAPDREWLRADVADVAPGVAVAVVSTAGSPGVGELAPHLAFGRTAALLGHSGAGKSSLVNTLVGATTMTTRELRADGRGRHTTTHRELVPLPAGGVLIDTPGLRGVAVYEPEDADGAAGVDEAFADVVELAARCRFGDCGHSVEPGCAVLAAVNDGTLPVRRLEGYRALLGETAWTSRRRHDRLKARRARSWRTT